MTDPYADAPRPAAPQDEPIESATPADGTMLTEATGQAPRPAPAADGPSGPSGSSVGALGRTIAGVLLLLIAFGAGFVVGNSRLADGAPSAPAQTAAPVAVVSSTLPSLSIAPHPTATDIAAGETQAPGATEPTATQPPASEPSVSEPPATEAPAASEPPGGPGQTVPDNAPKDFGVFWEALKLIQDKFVDPTKANDQNLTWGAIRGMTEALGDTGHSVFMTPDELKADTDSLSGKITGIGVVVDQRSESPVIISVVPDSPADGAGLKAGDTIVAIDGTDTDRLTVDQVTSMIRGEAGTQVTLSIKHPGADEPVDVTITRAEIQLKAASWALIPGTQIADVRVLQFSSGAGDAAKQAIQEALDAGATSIVVDLRGNPGGYVNEAIELASQFLPEGTTIYQDQDRDGNTKPILAQAGGIAGDVPIAVLVDYGSASSSEIFSAGIQGNDRGPIVGQQTFGTGTVLNTFTLSDGSAIRLGVVRWLTPDGTLIFGKGITPDISVKQPNDGTILEPGELSDMSPSQFADSTDVQLQKAVDQLR